MDYYAAVHSIPQAEQFFYPIDIDLCYYVGPRLWSGSGLFVLWKQNDDTGEGELRVAYRLKDPRFR